MKKVIIIGAGILGATTAYRLAKWGMEVVIIDQERPGLATAAAAGIICPWISQRRNKAWYHLAIGGARVYPSLIQELEKDGELQTGYAKVGALSVHHKEEKLFAIKERAETRRETAPEIGEVSILEPIQAQKMFPLLEKGYGAVHISGAGRVNGLQLRKALLQGAKKYGASLITSQAALLHKGGKINGVKAGEKTIEADLIIATNGAWMNKLLEPLGIHYLGYFQKGQLIHLQMPNIDTSKFPVILPPTSQSIVPFEDHIVIGATHENDTGFDFRVTAGAVHDILTKALYVAPELKQGVIKEIRTGFRPFTPDFSPVIGKLPGFEQIILANGLGSSGLTTGPFVGTELAKLALDQPTAIDLESYPVRNAIK